MDYPWILPELSLGYPWSITRLSLNNPWISLDYTWIIPISSLASRVYLGLLLFETFWLFFFTNIIYRGARAPKNQNNYQADQF